ncbi:MAG: acyl carrier protein [Bacilli bacterium]
MANVLEKVTEILVDELGCDATDVKLEANIIEDLDADSLSVMEVIMNLEEEYDIEVEEDAIKTLKTVGDVVTFIEGKL